MISLRLNTVDYDYGIDSKEREQATLYYVFSGDLVEEGSMRVLVPSFDNVGEIEDLARDSLIDFFEEAITHLKKQDK